MTGVTALLLCFILRVLLFIEPYRPPQHIVGGQKDPAKSHFHSKLNLDMTDRFVADRGSLNEEEKIAFNFRTGKILDRSKTSYQEEAGKYRAAVTTYTDKRRKLVRVTGIRLIPEGEDVADFLKPPERELAHFYRKARASRSEKQR